MTFLLRPLRRCLVSISLASLLLGCAAARRDLTEPRTGDEIVVCGQFVHTGAPVVLWIDPGGYDAYRVERRFVPWEQASWDATTRETITLTSPNRYGVRFAPRERPDFGGPPLSPQELERVRGGGWDLTSLQARVDQLVFHYDACGLSRECFRTVHDERGLSVHFMLDIDGTIYQTLDVKERAFHATTSNSRSIGIEIANIGAYPIDSSDATLDQWYRTDEAGQTRIVLPTWAKQQWIRTPNFVGRPIRDEPVVGEVQHQQLRMFDLTPQQYESLIRLTSAICRTFPKIRCDYPRDESGQLILHKLPDDRLATYQGLIGHYHIQANKVDPGPAFQWDRIVTGVQRLNSSAPTD